MLDVHPPAAAIHGWKDFLVHIAAITLGLLIAIGLEQTVEYAHHREQLRAVRQELATELDENRRVATVNELQFVKVRAEMDKDMEILRASRAEHFRIASQLDYSWKFTRTHDSAWEAATQTGVLSLIPHDELHLYGYDYAVFGDLMDALTEANVATEVAGAIARRVPDGRFSPQDIDELISATSNAQGKLAFAERLLQFEQAGLKRTAEMP